MSMSTTVPLTDSLHPHQQQKNNGRSKRAHPLPPPSSPLCDKSSAAALDLVILLFVLAACCSLFTPYFRYICREAIHFVPATISWVVETVYHAPIVYASASFVTFAGVLAGLQYYQLRARKCDNPNCKGLRNAKEFDIQLEPEDCTTSSLSQDVTWDGCVELGEDHKELHAGLKRMAQPNGRAVLVLRAPCGCPAARMEVKGSKKSRRSKKGNG